MRKLIDWVNHNPKNIFIVDGLGALLSAFLLGVVLVKLEYIFGIPKSMLYVLAFIPCVFVVYDIISYLINNKNQSQFIRYIAYLNIGYCFLSIGMAINHYENITIFGWIYIFLELLILIWLSIYELKLQSRMAE